MELIKEWDEFCCKRGSFDFCHFSSMFLDNLSDEFLVSVFQYFPERDELLKRMQALRDIFYLEGSEPIAKTTVEELVQLSKFDIYERKKACKLLGDNTLPSAVRNARVLYVDDYTKVRAAKNGEVHRNLVETVDSFYIGNIADFSDKKSALYNAFFTLTNSLELQWYLAKPFFRSAINPDYYFDLRSKGGDYALIDGLLLVTSYQV